MKPSSKYMSLAVTLGVSLFLFSCKKDFLTVVPPTSLTPEQALSKEADLQVALRGAYQGLRTGVTSYTADMYGRSIPILGDLLADNTYQSAQNTNRYTLHNNFMFNVTDGNSMGIWSGCYSVILRANNIINSAVASNANVDQYKGEAHAIRALAYFTLVRFFSRPYTDAPTGQGVPIITTYDPGAKPGRSSIAEVYTLINDDLNKAYSLLTKFTNSSQFNKHAAKALQAKVYLTMGDMANAKTAALDVINNGGFTPLTTANHAGYWANSAITTSKLETIFEVSSDAVGNLSFDALSYLYSQAGNYGDMLCADDLYALYEAGDVRRALYPTGTRGGLPSVFINKYPVITGDVSDTKVLRLSEMYLIAAEASLPANETDARTYVNFVTSRRGASPITSTGSQLLEDIIRERRKELAFEGDRYFDLMRLKRTVQRSTNYPATARSITYDNYRRILPIPQIETDANPTIKAQQNPGY